MRERHGEATTTTKRWSSLNELVDDVMALLTDACPSRSIDPLRGATMVSGRTFSYLFLPRFHLIKKNLYLVQRLP
ncbi:MAG: hypothetical protein ACYC3X_30865 [Pirellulaceae bacterium]